MTYPNNIMWPLLFTIIWFDSIRYVVVNTYILLLFIFFFLFCCIYASLSLCWCRLFIIFSYFWSIDQINIPLNY